MYKKMKFGGMPLTRDSAISTTGRTFLHDPDQALRFETGHTTLRNEALSNEVKTTALVSSDQGLVTRPARVKHPDKTREYG